MFELTVTYIPTKVDISSFETDNDESIALFIYWPLQLSMLAHNGTDATSLIIEWTAIFSHM